VVLKFAPITRDWAKIKVDEPASLGAVGTPEWYYEIRYGVVNALKNSIEVIEEVHRDFERWFGRRYGFVETYMVDDADTVIVTYGALHGVVLNVVNRLRKEGHRVGALRLRVIRPWPMHVINKELSHVDKIVVIDRAFNHGGPMAGPMATEIAASLGKPVYPMLATIGMRAVDSDQIEHAVRHVIENRWRPWKPFYIGLRGWDPEEALNIPYENFG